MVNSVQQKLNQLKIAKEKFQVMEDGYQKLLDCQSQIIQTKSRIKLLRQLVQDELMNWGHEFDKVFDQNTRLFILSDEYHENSFKLHLYITKYRLYTLESKYDSQTWLGYRSEMEDKIEHLQKLCLILYRKRMGDIRTILPNPLSFVNDILLDTFQLNNLATWIIIIVSYLNIPLLHLKENLYDMDETEIKKYVNYIARHLNLEPHHDYLVTLQQIIEM